MTRPCPHGQRVACRACAARVESIGLAAAMLKQARELLARRDVNAPQARAAVARALKSVDGAVRHASRGMGPSIRRASRPARRLFVLHIWGDVEPNLRGPFRTEAERLTAARSVRHADPSLRDGLYRLDVSPNGRAVAVGSFTDGELEAKPVARCQCGHAQTSHAGELHNGPCHGCEDCERFTFAGWMS